MSLLIQPRDCLYTMYEELRAQAKTLNPGDIVPTIKWCDHCRDLLAEVPDPTQRMAWSYYLAQDLSQRMPGVNESLVLGWLRQGQRP